VTGVLLLLRVFASAELLGTRCCYY
jgi:hypothetical protein